MPSIKYCHYGSTTSSLGSINGVPRPLTILTGVAQTLLRAQILSHTPRLDYLIFLFPLIFCTCPCRPSDPIAVATSSSATMDQLTSDLSRATLGTSATTAYEQAFNRIVAFVGKIRNLSPVDDADEISVTRALASPFTPSGTLVLLTEPREYHPWDQGTDQVISTCNSLEVLDEGFRIATQGQYNLATHVSVLDVRPFLPKSRLPSDEEVLTELYDLVFSAIKAKNPTALLCVGNVGAKFRCSVVGESKTLSK